MECTTYEGLLNCLKFLDAHIDKSVSFSFLVTTFYFPSARYRGSLIAAFLSQVTMTASTIIARTNLSKSLTATAVRFVHTDPLTGFKEYYVVPNNKKCGSWYSDESIDLYSLIQYRLEHRRRQKGKQMSKLERTAPCSAKSKPPAKTSIDNCANNRHEAEFQAAMDKHRDETLRLLKLSAAKGEACVPTNMMIDTRNMFLVAMTTINLSTHSGGKKLFEHDLTSLLAKAERDAIVLFSEELRQKRGKVAKSQSK